MYTSLINIRLYRTWTCLQTYPTETYPVTDGIQKYDIRLHMILWSPSETYPVIEDVQRYDVRLHMIFGWSPSETCPVIEDV